VKRPILHLLAGPNGAGKSTLYATVIQVHFPSTEFVNADLLAAAHFGHHARTADEAAYGQRAADERRKELLAAGRDLVAETVFSHPSKLDLVTDAQARGHEVRLYHVHVATADIAWSRIGRRVDEGGHDVPEDKARERYERNQALILRAAHIADRCYVFDNSTFGQPPRRVLEFRAGELAEVSDRVPGWAQALYREDLTAYSPKRLNAAAESFVDATRLVERVLGPTATLCGALRERGAAYEGQILGVTELHLVQRLGAFSAVAHFRSAFRGAVVAAGNAIVIYTGRDAELVALDRPIVRAALGRRYEGDVVAAGWRGVLQQVGDTIVRHRADALAADRDKLKRGTPAVIEYGDDPSAVRVTVPPTKRRGR